MAALRIDMMTRLAKAPRKTVMRGCLVAMIAAIRNVLSPAQQVSYRKGSRGERRTDLRDDNHDKGIEQGG